MINKAKIKILKYARKALRKYSIFQLKKNKLLWRELNVYRSNTGSTGCSWIDLWTLYRTVRIRKPKEILECGPGVSTLIMSLALMENGKEGFPGRITAMEEDNKFLEMAYALQPDYLRSFVDFHHSPKREDYYYLFRGVRYSNVPNKAYDFVFIDGPTLDSTTDGQMTFDYDFINVAQRAIKPVYGIVDYRLTTSFVFQAIFGLEMVKFDAVRELAFVGPLNRDNLVDIDLEVLTANLLSGFHLIGNSRIRLR